MRLVNRHATSHALLALLAALFWTTAAYSDVTSRPQGDMIDYREGAGLLKSDAIDFKTLLSPPAADSEQTRKEIEQMLVLQQRRTPEDVARAKSEVQMTPFIFSHELGSWFNPDDLPVTAALLASTTDEAHPIYSAAKEFFGRTRPFLTDSRIKPCVHLEKSSSYPSGHATLSIVWGTIIADILPDKKDAIMARAIQIGDDRPMAGMHFPSDVEAGRKLGAAIAKALLENPEFQKELTKAKEECAAARKKHAQK